MKKIDLGCEIVLDGESYASTRCDSLRKKSENGLFELSSIGREIYRESAVDYCAGHVFLSYGRLHFRPHSLRMDGFDFVKLNCCFLKGTRTDRQRRMINEFF